MRGKDSLRVDTTLPDMNGLTKDQVLSMHYLSTQINDFKNLPYSVSGNDVSGLLRVINFVFVVLEIH